MTDETAASCFSVGSVAGVYDELYVPRIFVPWAKLLLERTHLRRGEAVLDIATGPGTVARLAAEQVGHQGRVLGADFSEAMIAIARSKPPSAGAAAIEYVVSPAAPLAVEDGGFDVVTCQQGLQFFPDRPAAVREMHRALKPGGRVAAAVWREIGFQPSFAAIDSALRESLPDRQAEPFGLPFRWPKAADLSAIFDDHGFADVSVAEVRRPLIYEGGMRQAFATLAASPVATAVAALDGEARARLWSAVQRRLAPLVIDGQVRTHMVSNIVTARKPL
jgi:SAM-dependent methyltransferase